MAADGLKLGLQLFERQEPAPSGEAGTPEAVAAAVRMLYGLATTEATQLDVLSQAAGLAASGKMYGSYPTLEARWLIAQAQNAARSATAARRQQPSAQFQAAAERLTAVTASSPIVPAA